MPGTASFFARRSGERTRLSVFQLDILLISLAVGYVLLLLLSGPLIRRGVQPAVVILSPLLYAGIAYAMLWVLMWHRWRKRRRWMRSGRCTKCGYDMRGHRPPHACPECGRTYLPRVG